MPSIKRISNPPRVGEAMPDGYSRITAVFIDGDTHGQTEIRVRFGPWWAEYLNKRWPVTNRKAKRLRGKMARRARLGPSRDALHDGAPT